MAEQLAALQGRILTPTGWLALQDAPYSLADETYAKFETKIRRTEATSPFLEGSWLVHAVRENETFDLVVRVQDDEGQGVVWEAVHTLRQALLQRRFTLQLTLGTYQVAHTCFMADHTVEMNKPMLYASMAVVKAQIQAIPNVDGYEQAAVVAL